MSTTSEGKRLVEGEAEHMFPGLITDYGIFEFEESSTSSAQTQMAPSFNHMPGVSCTNNKQPLDEHVPSEFINLERASTKEKIRNQSLCRSMPVFRSDKSDTVKVG